MTLATIKLKAGHRYLIFAMTETSSSGNGAIMSCRITVEGGTTAKKIGGKDTRTTMQAGGGCTNWMYVETKTDAIISLGAYGYADATYDYTGTLMAIQLR